MPPEESKFPRRRLGILLWSAGTLGSVAVTVTVLPMLSGTMPLPGPLWLILTASFFQSALIVALAVWAGVTLAPAVGLRAPAFEAAARRVPVLPVLRPQILPGLIAGILGGPFLFASLRSSPEAIAALQGRFEPPLAARVLYGGITEEVLLRWGLMTAFTWLAWRLLQGKRGPVSSALVWIAIVTSALVFGAGHLPVAAYLIGSLNLSTVSFVVGVNAVFGILFSWLYWRRGLESAMIAHAVTHVVSQLIASFSGGTGTAW